MGIFFESSFEGVGGGKYMYIPLNSYIFSKTSKVKVGLLTHFFGKSLVEIYKLEDKIAKPILLTNTPLGCLKETGSPTVSNTCRWVRLPLSDSVEPEWSWISPREARLEAAERMIHNHEAEPGEGYRQFTWRLFDAGSYGKKSLFILLSPQFWLLCWNTCAP